MDTPMTYTKLAKSSRPPIPGSRDLGAVDPSEVIEVTVRLRPRTPLAELSKHVHSLAAQAPADRRHLSREEFAREHGASPEDIAKVKAFAHDHDLTVKDASEGRRSVHLIGSAEAMSKAFQTTVNHYQHDSVDYRSHTDHLHVPSDIGDVVEAVFGFDTRPYVRPHYQILSRPAAGPEATEAGFTPLQVAEFYQFPSGDGTGQTVGIIELSAPKGSGYRAAELKTYFKSLGITTPPSITAVSVDGGKNHPGTNPDDQENADGEVVLDIEVAASVAPKAKFIVYFAPNTPQGFVDAINQAVHDSTNNPSVLSCSWGGPEDPTDSANDQINQILQAGASMGVTFCVASGDSGSNDAGDGKASVDFPASSPYALACGGTSITVSGTTITDEVVWQDSSGGGVSRTWPLPTWQENAGVPAAVNPAGPVMRGVPDVAGDADPNTGYNILVDGQKMTIGGTSAVAPLWAGLVARLNQNLGHSVGFLNPTIYQHPEAFNDITSGSNGDYSAGRGWDPCTGLGSPIGSKLLTALGSTSNGSTKKGDAGKLVGANA